MIIGLEPLHQMNKQVHIIRQRMKEAQDRYKSWADLKRRPLEFQNGDHVYVKITPFKGLHCFGIKGKLSPRYIRPFEVLEGVGKVAYRLALPLNLANYHDIFHVLILQKYVKDPNQVKTRSNSN